MAAQVIRGKSLHGASVVQLIDVHARCIDLANASESDLQALSDACQPATFGRNDVDVYDESYRKAGKMDAGDFATKFDPEDCGLLDLVADDFLDCGSDVKSRVICELYKLNVYGA